MTEHVSQRQFAKEIGRSHVWVSKLVKSGKIPTNDKGKIPLQAGLAAYQASQDVSHEGSREYHAKKRAQGSKAKAAPKQPATPPAADEPTEEAPALPANAIGVARVNEQYNKAKLAEKTYQAKLKQLEWERSQGELLTKEEVRADAMKTAEELHGLLMPMGNQIAPLCEGKSAREIEVIIEDAIQDALIALQSSTFARSKAEKAAKAKG